MKRVLCSGLLVLLAVSCFAADSVPQELERKSFEPENVDPQRLMDEEESTEYSLDANKRIFAWWKTLDDKITDERSNEFIGAWYLEDKKGGKINRSVKGGSMESFDVLIIGNQYYYSTGGYDSYLHFSDEGNVYITPEFLFGVVKEMKIYNDRLYLYILTGDKWILDPIHDGGKYSYKKGKSRDIVIP